MKELLLTVEKHRELIFAAERYIWKHPETGYRETATTAYLAEKFKALGYELHMAEDITGFYTVLDTGRPGPTLLVMAELDSVLCPTHPAANPETGAVHACGHHAQCAALLGLAAALREPRVQERLCGRIKLCAVPAEELLEVGYRTELYKAKKIRFFGGKPEFLSRGYFDDVDIAMMVHTGSGYKGFAFTPGSVGCRAKTVIYRGRAAHAGGSPWAGRNALYAATQGLGAVNAIRETFRDGDMIRVHPIITHGGDVVNVIPDRVEIESYVRGKTIEAMEEANRKVDRAFIGGALSLGVNIEIRDIPGYAPFENCPELISLSKGLIEKHIPDSQILDLPRSSGSTDNGDLCAVMPVIQPYCGGAVGAGHGSDYFIEDREVACVNSAKLQLLLLCALCENGGKIAADIKAAYKPRFDSIKKYVRYMESLYKEGNRLNYEDDYATAILK